MVSPSKLGRSAGQNIERSIVSTEQAIGSSIEVCEIELSKIPSYESFNERERKIARSACVDEAYKKYNEPEATQELGTEEAEEEEEKEG